MIIYDCGFGINMSHVNVKNKIKIKTYNSGK